MSPKKKLILRPFFESNEHGDVKISNQDEQDCNKCGLYKTCISPKMPVTGEGEQGILIIAEAPGAQEDEENQQLVGEAGQFLRKLLKRRGMDLDRDFWKTNALICRPPKNRKPKRNELKLCRRNLLKVIEEKKPKFIWLFGNAAIESFFMERFKDEDSKFTPTRWRGLCIPEPSTNAWVIPMFHPSYAKRFEHDDLIVSQFERDLDFAIDCLNEGPVPHYDPFQYVEILTDYHDVCDLLEGLIDSPPDHMTFDYETTGLKPFNKGHKIACMSICCRNTKAYAFPIQHPHFKTEQQRKIADLVRRLLEGPSKKIAHNLKYEDVWSRWILKAETMNWHWCTMNAAHILDNRRSFTGLKFQAYWRWGIEEYDSSVKPYLKPKKGHQFNGAMEAPLEDLLTYNAIDALLTMWLYEAQIEEMSKKDRMCNDFFLDGLLALSDIQITGINTDPLYYEDIDKELAVQLTEITRKLEESKEAKLFQKEVGRPIKFSSDKDLRELFFDIMKLPVTKKTDTDLPSVDAETLLSLDSDIARDLIKMSKIDKIKGTYIGQFLREIDDDNRLRPFFNLHLVNTYRSSSQGPNFQNIPVRDETAKKYTRSGIFPSKGNLLLDWDYGALEVRIIACATQDPILVKYCTDPSTDMHRDLAAELFKLDHDNVSKKLRFHAKNGFTFPEFYGSYYKNCARNVWTACEKEQLKTQEGQDIFEHLCDAHVIKSVYDYDGFEEHVQEVEEVFWEKYRATRTWQENQYKFYEKYGYVETMTGFRFTGYMTRNKLVNYPIQGSAFHCLLYSLINIHDHLLDHNMNSKILGQIHDCLLFDVHPKERDHIVRISQRIACEQIREDWRWIIVPLVIEVEETEIDGSWYSKIETHEDDGFFDVGEEDE